MGDRERLVVGRRPADVHLDDEPALASGVAPAADDALHGLARLEDRRQSVRPAGQPAGGRLAHRCADERRRLGGERPQPGAVDVHEPVVRDLLAREQRTHDVDALAQPGVARRLVRPALARDVLVGGLAGAERDPQPPREHLAHRRRRLGDDRRVVALAGRVHDAERQRGRRHRGAEPRPGEARLALALAPRREVVGGHAALEPGGLRRAGDREQHAGRDLLVRVVQADDRHAGGPYPPVRQGTRHRYASAMASTVPVDLTTSRRSSRTSATRSARSPRSASRRARRRSTPRPSTRGTSASCFAEQDILGLPFAEEYGGTGTGTLMLQIAVEEIAKACASSALILMVQELGTLPIQLFGSRRAQGALPAALRDRRVVAGVLRCPSPRPARIPAAMRTTRRPRRRRVGHQRHEELDHERRDRRLLRRVRGHRPRDAPAQRVRRRDRPPGLQRRQARAQARHPAARRPASRSSRTSASRPRTSSAPRARACPSRWRRSSALAARRRGAGASASRRARPTTPSPTRRSASPFGKPIIEFQGIQFKLADMETRTAAARELLYKACAMADRGERDLGKYSSMAKLFASRHGDGGDGRGGPGPRRLRLRQRVPGRADDARREDHADLRGHQRDPARRDREGAAER